MKYNDQGVALILDGQFMSALAVTRSLGARGIRVIVASPEERPIAGASRFCALCRRYPDPTLETSGFLDAVEELIKEFSPDLVIPVTEKTLIPLAEQRARFTGRTRLAMADNEALALVLDKNRTAELAASLDIPVPRSILAEDNRTLLEAGRGLGYPLVLKPVSSISRREGRIGPQLAVRYAFGEDELLRVATPLLEQGAIVAQEYFSGQGIGVEVIADKGESYCCFQHRRLHEVPLSGGGSSLRISEPVNPALEQAARRIIAALNWHGVAMVEFKYQPDTGEFRLMEINGRIWGSLPLSRVAGVDFPWLLWKLFVHEERAENPSARPGVLCRDLGKDIYWHESVLRKVADPRLFSYPSKTRLLLDLLQAASPKHHVDSFWWRDPGPFLRDLKKIFSAYASRMTNLRRHRKVLALQERGWKDGTLPAQLGRCRRLLIICYGNINRSAAAHALLTQRWGDRIDVAVESAGFHPQGGREPDPRMVAAAAQEELDLSCLRSSVVTTEKLKAADLILVMEVAHLARVGELCPEATDRAWLLGAPLSEAGEAMEIEDPYGREPEAYRQCLAKISRAVGAIAPRLPGKALPARGPEAFSANSATVKESMC